MKTTKTAHTPGPWRYEASTKTIRSIPTNYWLATMDSWDGAINNEANARLIASAPALAAMVRALRDAAVNTPALDSSEDWSALIAQADKTLSDATGAARLFN